MRCSLKPGFTSLHPPSSPPAHRLVPLSISDTHLHAHPREATLATTRSLEERRRTGVRILIYIYAAPSTVQLFSGIIHPHPPPTPYFIFSDKIQFKRNGTRVNVPGCVVVGGWGWKVGDELVPLCFEWQA